MITIKTGQIFCKEYNRRFNTELSPKEIFCTVMAPLCFKSLKQCMNLNNSAFDLKYIFTSNNGWGKDEDVMKRNCCTYEEMIVEKTQHLERIFPDKLEEFCLKLENDKDTKLPTTLKVYGGCADKPDNTTRFCGCENIYITIDERYCSFIGAMLSIGFGGFIIPLNDTEYIWKCYEALLAYRDLLDNNDYLKGNQLNQWNVIYLLKKNDNNNVKQLLSACEEIKNGVATISSKKMNIRFVDILRLFLAKRKRYIELASFGQQNKTCGAIEIVDIENTERQIAFVQKIVKDLEYEYDIDKVYDNILSKSMLYDILKVGYITEKMFDPVCIVRDYLGYNEGKKKDKITVRIVKQTIEYIMNSELKVLCDETIKLIETVNATKSKMRTAREHIFSSNNCCQFAERLDAYINEYGTKNDESKRICCAIMEISKEDFDFFRTKVVIELR